MDLRPDLLLRLCRDVQAAELDGQAAECVDHRGDDSRGYTGEACGPGHTVVTLQSSTL